MEESDNRSPMAKLAAASLAAALLGLPATAAPTTSREVTGQAQPEPRHVRIIATGGTIAGRAPEAADLAGYRSGAIPVEELVEAVPSLDEVADVSHEQYSNVGSTSLAPADWLRLAQRVDELFRDGVDGDRVDGVVITHGTDALEETAYFLDLTVRHERPVVVVGAMRPATAISADGPLNLLNAVRVAAHPGAAGRGVLVVLNQEIHEARDATKGNTRRVETFTSRDWGLLGVVDPDGPVFYRRSERRHRGDSEFDIVGLEPADLPRVDIVYSYNGADGAGVRGFTEAGAVGIVVAGSGAGATSPELGEALADAAESGVYVVRASRTGSGRVAWGGRGDGNVLPAGDLIVQKARILLMVALAHTRDPAELRRIFSEY